MTKEQKAVSDRIKLADGFKNKRLEALFRREKMKATAMKTRLFFAVYAIMYSYFAAFSQFSEVRAAGAAMAVLSVVFVIRVLRRISHLNYLTGGGVLLLFVFCALSALSSGKMPLILYAGIILPFLLLEMPLKALIYLTVLPFTALIFITNTGSALLAVFLELSGICIYTIYGYMRRSYFLHMRREKAGQRSSQTIKSAGNGKGKDTLTGLITLGVFLELAEKIMETPSKNDSFMIVLDIDGFEKINRAFGQESGDMILKETAQRLKSLISPADLLARTGGGEFALLLADETEKHAKGLTERIRVNMENSRWKTQKSEAVVTISAGIALVCPEGMESAADVFHKAREAMFTAKSHGRNRIAMYGDADC
jgi:diguanylate cyclase (GGDEF)-like protein